MRRIQYIVCLIMFAHVSCMFLKDCFGHAAANAHTYIHNEIQNLYNVITLSFGITLLISILFCFMNVQTIYNYLDPVRARDTCKLSARPHA